MKLPGSVPSDISDIVPDDSLFLMDSSDPWYGDILMYLQPNIFGPHPQKMIVNGYDI